MGKQIAVCIALFASLTFPAKAQDKPAAFSAADRTLAINFLRAVNTAEMRYKLTHDKYVAWEVLQTTKEFTEVGLPSGVKSDPELGKVSFGAASAVMPGWKLRLNISADGQKYDALLETVKQCGYAAQTDERGLIREARALGCDD